MSELVEQARPRNIRFVSEQEPMNIYQLENGDVVKCKLVLMNVTWDGKTYNPDGTRSYMLNFNNSVLVIKADNT